MAACGVLLWSSACRNVMGQDRPEESDLKPVALRCEYLEEPMGMEERRPRLSWQVESDHRGQRQTAYRVLVASSKKTLAADKGDLWDSGQVANNQTIQIEFGGKALKSRQQCFWKVMVWDKAGRPSSWSVPARWSMGLLEPSDWKADWISFQDNSALHKSRDKLYLPSPRLYRKPFQTERPIRRATVYASALGIYDLYLNGQRVCESYFAPGWSDYRQRAYYNTFDVTGLVRRGENVLGSAVAEGWYSGYVGFGLLVGYGPNRVGRYFYGKTPALLVQLEIEYEDGTCEMVPTDPTWQVTDRHATREADMLMGETYDARLERRGWSEPGYAAKGWHNAIRAENNGSTKTPYFDRGGEREVELGFIKPRRLQAFPGVPVRPMQEIKPVAVTKPQKGVVIYDMGQNFSGVVRLQVKGPAGARVQLRFGEMLHPDGRLMTENLRRARNIDVYILRGDPEGETWTPRFTYHGFQFVETTVGQASRLSAESGSQRETDKRDADPTITGITGIVLHSDTPLVSSFECSDPMINKLFQNIVWTQRSNFLEVPTDCPQRDERLGWTGDAQAYVRTATYNADVAAFFTKWLDDLEESQRPNGAYPAYAPFPMQHGIRGKAYGSAWMDAGIICPWTIWKVYGDTRVIDRHWDSMTRFMEFRKSISPDFRGKFVGNDWGDWLSVGKKTPIEFIDAVYFAYSTRLMADMALATGREAEAAAYRGLFERIQAAFNADYVNPDGSLKVDTQTAYALALFVGLLPDDLRAKTGQQLATLILDNSSLMATGFLGTRPLLPALSSVGQNDLAALLLQNRRYPSWGYEVVNGATTVWERWNSYTRGQGFMNPGMNSFSHYAFGAVCEWMFQTLAGIDTDGPGYQRIVIKPHPPAPAKAPADRSMQQAGKSDDAAIASYSKPIDWVRAEYRSIRGLIVSRWKREAHRFTLEVTVPANTTATVYVPATQAGDVTECGKSLGDAVGVRFFRMENDWAVIAVESGTYRFESNYHFQPSNCSMPQEVPEPPGASASAETLDLSKAKQIARWDFTKGTESEKNWRVSDSLRLVPERATIRLEGIGADPQMVTRLPQPVSGPLAIVVCSKPAASGMSQFFWAAPNGGYQADASVGKTLTPRGRVAPYVFRFTPKQPLQQLRFDPFSGQGQMQIESITLYQLSQKKD